MKVACFGLQMKVFGRISFIKELFQYGSLSRLSAQTGILIDLVDLNIS